MGKIIRPIDKLLWILNFINQDIDSFKTGDFLKNLAEISYNIHRLPFFMFPGSREDFLKLKSRENFLKLKKGKEPLYEEGIARFVEDTPMMRDALKNIHTRLKSFLEILYDAKNKYEKHTLDGVDALVTHAVLSYKVNHTIRAGHGMLYLSGDVNKYDLEEELAELLYSCSEPAQTPFGESRGHILEKLKKCRAPGCNNFFWEAHKKEKNYCSNKCAMRAYVKAKRDMEKVEKEIKPRHRKEV